MQTFWNTHKKKKTKKITISIILWNNYSCMVREKLESKIKRKEVPFVQRMISCMMQADLRKLSEHLFYVWCFLWGERGWPLTNTAIKCHKNWGHYERLQEGVVMSSEVGWRAASDAVTSFSTLFPFTPPPSLTTSLYPPHPSLYQDCHYFPFNHPPFKILIHQTIAMHCDIFPSHRDATANWLVTQHSM